MRRYITRLVLASIVLLSNSRPAAAQDEYEQVTAQPSTYLLPGFPGVDREALLLRLTGWNANSSARAGPSGLTLSRSLSIHLRVGDPTATQTFRVVGPLRLHRLVDDQGRDLATNTTMTFPLGITATPPSIVSFRSQGRMSRFDKNSTQNIVYTLSPCDEIPARFKEVAGEVNVALPVGVTNLEFPLSVLDQASEVAPGVFVQVLAIGPATSGGYPVHGVIRLLRSAGEGADSATPAIVSLALPDRVGEKTPDARELETNRFDITSSVTDTGAVATFSLIVNPGRADKPFTLEGVPLKIAVAKSVKIVSMPFSFKDISITDAVSTQATPPPAP